MIDVRSLVPLDVSTILDSVGRTSRLVTVEENPRLCGWGAEVASIVAEEGFFALDGPIVRVTTPHIPLPSADVLEDAAIPSVGSDRRGRPARRGLRDMDRGKEGEDMADRILLRGGTSSRSTPSRATSPGGDVLIEGDTIAQVGKDISADAEVIDCTGNIVIPGFVDTHRHTWEAAIRSCAPNATLDDYFVEVLDSFAPLYRPEDVYASNLAGALECLNAGITTLVDWSHINNTPDHPDAAIQG